MTEFKRQYLAVRLNPHGRTYTYHNDGPPLKEGDVVKCPDPRGNPGDWIRGYVVRAFEVSPHFETKGILGIVPK